jgi:hypothetical protein
MYVLQKQLCLAACRVTDVTFHFSGVAPLFAIGDDANRRCFLFIVQGVCAVRGFPVSLFQVVVWVSPSH